jgi:dynein heavy chain
MYEQFLEDINNILNTGEITNLYGKEDFEKMNDGLTTVLEKMRIPVTRDNIYQEFVTRLRDQFHIILCMSPIGDTLRIRCRMFPSLVNCCTLDWFAPWP